MTPAAGAPAAPPKILDGYARMPGDPIVEGLEGFLAMLLGAAAVVAVAVGVTRWVRRDG